MVDAANRVASKALSHPSSGSITYSFTYGTSGVEAGRLIQVSAPGLALGYSHNLYGQVTAASQALSGTATLTTSYGYANNGAPTSITYPSGRVVTLTLDGVSRVSGITVDGTSILSGVSYSPLGAVTGWAFAGGASVARTYDANARLTSVTMPWGARQYVYDVDDRIVGINDSLLGNAVYAYDDFDRLISASNSAGSWTYQYDANGNRTGGSVNGSSYGTSVDAASNRMLAAGRWQNTFTADGQTAQVANGPTTPACGPSLTLGYQADGQLVTSNVLSAVHAPNGLRLQKTAAACAGGAKTNFVYDSAGHLIGEYDAMGAVIQETVWLGDLPVAVFRPGSGSAPFYVYADNLGTPRGVTTAGGVMVWSWDGEPFGASPAIEGQLGQQGAFRLGLRFPGQYLDEETGYHHNGWREYDPALGRYVQSDPIGLEGGLNTYLYVGGNPLSYADPRGLDRWGDTMGLPTHVYITQSTGNGKDGVPFGAAGAVSVSGNSITFPANSFPDTSYGSPGIVDGTYHGVYGENAHLFPSVGKRGPGVILNNNRPIPTLGPNPAHGGQSIADGIHMHCQNYAGVVSKKRGSAGCLTIQGDYCEKVWDLMRNAENKNVIIHLERNQ